MRDTEAFIEKQKDTIDRLRSELAAQRAVFDRLRSDGVSDALAKIALIYQERDQARTRCDELEAALNACGDYMSHVGPCPWSETNVCTCGLLDCFDQRRTALPPERGSPENKTPTG